MFDTIFFLSSIFISIVSVVLFISIRLKKIDKKRRKILEIGLLHLTLFIIFSTLWFFKIAIDGFSQVFGLIFYLVFYLITYIIVITLISIKSREGV
ncbi:hypothetical protein EDD69_1305 [Thermolongibacillus altinsuensis]|uniref:Uncharacterized protein n=1 Tax=Thermolongibacillus altinsuensis TaxID=575256 RepID=A0A4R1Q6T6_9BACL|nr:hypothetical protein EDD69_1305 [Thermolongibacillus altinsuensis]